MKILIVVDMQNDFISGALGSPEAQKIVEPVAERVREFEGKIIFTRDTHTDMYMQTQEGRKLPVPHCIRGTHGWQIDERIAVPEGSLIFDKITFGSRKLAEYLAQLNENERIEEIELCGLCTDICVISNAFLVKAVLPECEITVNSALCRGVSNESHKNALNAMRACQINVTGEM